MNNYDSHEKAFNAYIKSGGKIAKAKIARKLGISATIVYKWAREEEWDNTLKSLLVTENKDPPSANNRSVSEFLPQKTANVISAIENMSGDEILWQNILLQYAAIIRSQKLLDIEDDEILTVEKRAVENENTNATEWENFTPWERCKIYLETQSKAMNVLTSMLKKFDDYKRQGLANDELSAKIDLIKFKAQAMTKKNSDSITVISDIPKKEK